MKHINFKILLVFTFCVMNLIAVAQPAGRTIELIGFVMVSFTDYGLEKAKVTLMSTDSTVIDTMSVRNERPSGYMVASSFSFKVPAKVESYIIKVDCEGYKSITVNYKLKHAARVLRRWIPAIKLVRLKSKHSLTGDNELGEVTVRATRIKFFHKGDTLVYNADAFNLPEGSMLDELIRQMPGARIEANGEIFINDKKIDYLTLNGKQLFKGNNLALLENMPYYTVKSLKVFEQSKEKNRNLNTKTDLKDNVMDVLLKKEYSQNNFGNIEAGVGTNDRWQVRGFDGYMIGSVNASAYANLNNINQSSVPGSDGSFWDSDSPKSIMNTKKVGVSTIAEKTGGTFYVSTDLAAQWQGVDLDEQKKQISILPQTNINKIFQNLNDSRNSSFSLNNKITKMGISYFQFQTMVDYGRSKNDDLNKYALFDKDIPSNSSVLQLFDAIDEGGRNAFDYLQNYSINKANNRAHNFRLRENIEMSQALAWGDDLIFHADASYSDNNQKLGENSHITYYLPVNDSIVSYVANDNTKTKSYSYTLEGFYHFNFLNNTSLEIGYRYTQGNESVSRQRTLDDLYDANSYHSNSLSREHKPMVNWEYKKGKWQLIAGFDVRMLSKNMSYSNSSVDTTLTRSYVDLCPRFRLKWQGKKSRIHFFNKLESYRKPSVLNLVETIDSSHPLVMSTGNGRLKKESMYDYQFTYAWHNTERQWDVNFSSQSQFMLNMIIMCSLYDDKNGNSLVIPQNVKGTWASWNRLYVDKGLGKSRAWNINNEIVYRKDVTTLMSGHMNEGLQSSKNKRDVLDETARLVFQHKELTLKLNAGFSYNSIRNKMNSVNYEAWDIRYGFNLACRLPWDIKFSGDLTSLTRKGYKLEEVNKTRVVSNISLYKTFLKGKITVQCKAYDIFHQLTNFDNGFDEQELTETTYNCIPRYGMISIGYRFGKK